MKGIWGKVLKVDLTNSTCKPETLPDKVYEYFLGEPAWLLTTCGRNAQRVLPPSTRQTGSRSPEGP